jgi:hypothetical protein
MTSNTPAASLGGSTASSAGLRSRKVDHKKAMKILKFDQVDDLDESFNITRVIPQVATGVEKGEEEVSIE